MIKDPVVETSATIKEFQLENNFSTKNSLILRGDSSSAFIKLMRGTGQGFYVFDSSGNLLCYNGSSTCQGVQFKQLLAQQKDSFRVCANKETNLENTLKETYGLNEQSVGMADFERADYYVVAYWQKFMGGKRGYKDGAGWMDDEIAKNQSSQKFTFIKINTDLQDTWGLVAGKKARLTIKNKKSCMELRISHLPLKK